MDVRKANLDDVFEVYRVQAACHDEDLLESEETFSKIIACDESFVGIDLVTSKLIGYLLCHRAHAPPKFNTIDVSSNNHQCPLFIHDIAIHPDYRGQGIASQLLQRITEPCTLLSLPIALSFWIKQGFIEHRENKDLDENIKYSYGRDVLYMERSE